MTRVSVRSMPGRRAAGGFSLLEMAVVLVIMALLVEMGVQLQRSGRSANVTAQQQGQLKQAHALIVQFALLHLRLPCPDITGSGVEAVQGDQQHCQSAVGALPYLTLGMLPGAQSAGTAMRYGVYGLATSASSALGGQTTRDQVVNFSASLTQAMQMPPTTSYPYVATDPDCGTAELNPAFALTLGGDAQAALSGQCFAAGQGAQPAQLDMESLTDLQTQVNDLERDLNPL